jgi:putative PIN family toxin of toxin-antitoxin system
MIRPATVIDTNVVVSGIIASRGPNAAVMDSIAADKLRLFVSTPILAEYENVLLRPGLRLDRERVNFTKALIRAKAILIHPTIRLSISPDEPDKRFLECAEAADADYLVTGNKKHFPNQWKRTRIVNARELLDILGVAAVL